MNNNDCAEYRELIPDYCIGALDAETAALVERKLDECPELAEELAAYRQLTEAMLFSAPPTKAPSHILTAIMDASDSRHHNLRWVPWLAAAIVVLLIGGNLYWVLQNRNLQDQVADLEATLTRVEAVTETPPTPVVQQQIPIGISMNSTMSQLNNFSTGPSNQIIAQQDDRQALLTWSPGAIENTWIGVFQAQNFRRPSTNNAYQLWLLDSERTPRSMGLFDVDAGGNGALVFEIEEPIETYEQVSVTVEPTGGSPKPTGETVIISDLSNWMTLP